jgi:cytosine/creatinine deaminase
VDLLIKQALVRDDEPLVDIAIHKGRIAAIDRHIDTFARRVIDAGGRAAIPGLLEPHLHLDKALLESRMPNRSGTLDEAIPREDSGQ